MVEITSIVGQATNILKRSQLRCRRMVRYKECRKIARPKRSQKVREDPKDPKIAAEAWKAMERSKRA